MCLVLLAGTRAYSDSQVSRQEQAPASFAQGRLKFIDAAALDKKIKQASENKATFKLVDLRNESEFFKGTLPRALNIPLRKLRFLAEPQLPKNEEIVVFGRSRQDVASVNAVIFLMNRGYNNAVYFEDGYQGWVDYQMTKAVTKRGEE